MAFRDASYTPERKRDNDKHGTKRTQVRAACRACRKAKAKVSPLDVVEASFGTRSNGRLTV